MLSLFIGIASHVTKMKIFFEIPRYLIISLIAMVTASCSKEPANSRSNTDFESRSEITDLHQKIDAQNAIIANMQKALSEADTKLAAQANTNSQYMEARFAKMAESLASMLATMESNFNLQLNGLRQSVMVEKSSCSLDPSEKGYGSVTTDKGTFLFAIDGAQPFLDGHKILLRIGNPMNMTFNGFKLKVKYGKRMPVFPAVNENDQEKKEAVTKWTIDYNNWLKSLRNIEISFPDTLSPGAWTKIDFTLKETKSEDVAYLEVSIITDQVLLRKPLEDSRQ